MCSKRVPTVFQRLRTCSKRVPTNSKRVPNVFQRLQTCSKCVQMCPNVFQTCSKRVPSVFRMCPNVFHVFRVCPNVFHTCLSHGVSTGYPILSVLYCPVHTLKRRGLPHGVYPMGHTCILGWWDGGRRDMGADAVVASVAVVVKADTMAHLI